MNSHEEQNVDLATVSAVWLGMFTERNVLSESFLPLIDVWKQVGMCFYKKKYFSVHLHQIFMPCWAGSCKQTQNSVLLPLQTHDIAIFTGEKKHNLASIIKMLISKSFLGQTQKAIFIKTWYCVFTKWDSCIPSGRDAGRAGNSWLIANSPPSARGEDSDPPS